jgi:AcrR family transcriptional regulator
MAVKTKQNRAETERRLIDAALGLIRRNGVLAGLNLREVADEAEVNRGNIYHYFGSRRELLRTAIARRFEAVIEALVADRRGVPFVERRLRAFRGPDLLQDSQLRALLVIDGDETVDPIPRFELALRGLQQGVEDGEIDRAHDLEALEVALSAMRRGYHLFREPYANRLGTDADDLDVRITRIMRVWLESMAAPPPH